MRMGRMRGGVNLSENGETESTDHIYLTEECTVVNAGMGSLHREFHKFMIPVGGATNMSRAYFGNFSCLFPIVT